MRNTLSLFNGIGVGIQALKEIGVTVEKSYISEIDKFANQTNMKNHPESIQLGDVTKWREWEIDWSRVDLVTAGFPCQAWSMAGQQLGDKDPRGALFWTTLEVISQVLKHNPNAKWLMENVRMKKEFEEYITHHTEQALGYVEKTLINSALVTAQNRQRYYWTNFKVSQPEDEGILLKDILEDNPDSIFNLSQQRVGTIRKSRTGGNFISDLGRKSGTITANYYKTPSDGQYLVVRPCELLEKETAGGHIANATDIKGHQSIKRVYSPEGKAPTLTTMGGGHREPKVLCGAMRGRYLVDGKRQDHKIKTAGMTTQRLEIRDDEKTNYLTTVQKDNVLTKAGAFYRKLTPLECERLQGYPDNYTEGVSNTQRYKQCGNGWTLPVIVHIFKEMLI